MSASNTDASRPWVFLLASAGIATTATCYYVYSAQSRLHTATQRLATIEAAPSGAPLRRSNAIRRTRVDGTLAMDANDPSDVTRSTAATNAIIRAVDDDDLTEISGDEEDAEDEDDPTAEDSEAHTTRLKQLIFAITKNRVKREGTTHRGITCDHCKKTPIVGVRYRCVNCPDFDLCEECESMDPHIRSHVFYKIKVPAPWAGKNPQPSFYPGRPWELPQELNRDTKKELHELHKIDIVKIEAYYEQWSCVANRTWPADPRGLLMGIDESAFRKCLVPHTKSRESPPPNLLHSRLFRFFDSNNDGVIGFEEFIVGMTFLLERDTEEEVRKRVFQSFDLDGDGWISRKDVQLLFRAFHDLNRETALDGYRMVEEGEDAFELLERTTARDFVYGGRSITSYFPSINSGFLSNSRSRMGKLRAPDVNGDIIPVSSSVTMESHDSINVEDLVGGTWTAAAAELDLEASRLFRGLPLKYLTKDEHIKIKKGNSIPKYFWGTEQASQEPLFWYEYATGSVSGDSSRKFTIYLPVGVDLSRTFQKHMSPAMTMEKLLENENNREKSATLGRFWAQNVINQKRRAHQESRLADRERYDDFYLDRPQNPANLLAESRQTKEHLQELQQRGFSDERGFYDEAPEQAENDSQTTDHNTQLIGGTEAGHIIALVAEQAMNDMLDAFFRPEESLAKHLEETASARESFKVELDAFDASRQDAFDRATSPDQSTVPKTDLVEDEDDLRDAMMSIADAFYGTSGVPWPDEPSPKSVTRTLAHVSAVSKLHDRPTCEQVFAVYDELFGADTPFKPELYSQACDTLLARRSCRGISAQRGVTKRDVEGADISTRLFVGRETAEDNSDRPDPTLPHNRPSSEHSGRSVGAALLQSPTKMLISEMATASPEPLTVGASRTDIVSARRRKGLYDMLDALRLAQLQADEMRRTGHKPGQIDYARWRELVQDEAREEGGRGRIYKWLCSFLDNVLF